jgi:8-oxo-dGTP pyrophosphatase MutT (NUDIX family)
VAEGLPPDWPERLRRCLLAVPDHSAHIHVGGADPRVFDATLAPDPGAWTQAAVLVPVIERGADSTILLTRRQGQLRRHAGQISFPGGRIDQDAEDAVAAALRETEEETGLARSFVQPLGYLPDHLVLTGFRITPVVALVRPGFALQAQAAEVAELIELPLALALDPGCYVQVVRKLRERELVGHDLRFGDHQIWGATAAMLRHLCLRFHGEILT